MKRNFKILLVMCLMLIAVLSMTVTSAYADPYDSSGSLDEVMGDTSASEVEIENYINDKGGAIISIMQTAARPILVGAFILFLILAVFGLFGQGKHVFFGIIGIIGCGVCLFGVYYAYEIVDWIKTFMVPDGEPVYGFILQYVHC